MILTSQSLFPTDTLERLAWPGAAAVLSVVSWVVFLLTEESIWLQVTINVLLVLAVYIAGALHKRLLLTLLTSVLIIHFSFYALYSWPIPNIVIAALSFGSLAIIWHSTMGSRFRSPDMVGLLGTTLLTWLAAAYLPSNLVNATTLTALPLFVLLPAVYHQKFQPAWLISSFFLCSAAAIVIIQTTVLYSV
jgi:hypothetical protein